MGIFVINLCAVAAAIWLFAGFTHFVIAWNNFEVSKFNRSFIIDHLLGAFLLLMAFAILWSIHIDLLTSNHNILEIIYMVLIGIGMPVVKIPVKHLYLDLKKYSDN